MSPEFQAIYRNFLKTNCGSASTECDAGKQKYYQWLNSRKLDDTKPYSGQSGSESFAWLAMIEPVVDKIGKKNLIKIEAIHGICTRNRNCYDWGTLSKTFASAQGKPLDWAPWSKDFHGDIHAPRGAEQEVGEVVFAYPNDKTETGEILGSVSDEVYGLVQSGEITSASIVATSLGDFVDEKGKHVMYPIITRVALLPKGAMPGDPKAKVTILESWIPVWESYDMEHDHAVNGVRNDDFLNSLSGVIQTKETKQMVEEGGASSASGQGGQGAASTSSGKELHFIGSKVGPIMLVPNQSSDSYNTLPDNCFADEKQHKYPHHHRTNEVDINRLQAEALLAQNRNDKESYEHLDKHMRILKVGPYAVASEGLPTDGRWVPEGFTMRGNRVYPTSEEVWQRYLAAESVFVRVGAMWAAQEESIFGAQLRVNEAKETATSVAGLVTGGNYVSKAEFDKACTAQKILMSETLKDYIKNDQMPSFVKESVAQKNIEALEGAAYVIEAIRTLKNRLRPPRLGFNPLQQTHAMRGFTFGRDTTIEAVLNILKEEAIRIENEKT